MWISHIWLIPGLLRIGSHINLVNPIDASRSTLHKTIIIVNNDNYTV